MQKYLFYLEGENTKFGRSNKNDVFIIPFLIVNNN